MMNLSPIWIVASLSRPLSLYTLAGSAPRDFTLIRDKLQVSNDFERIWPFFKYKNQRVNDHLLISIRKCVLFTPLLKLNNSTVKNQILMSFKSQSTSSIELQSQNASQFWFNICDFRWFGRFVNDKCIIQRRLSSEWEIWWYRQWF